MKRDDRFARVGLRVGHLAEFAESGLLLACFDEPCASSTGEGRTAVIDEPAALHELDEELRTTRSELLAHYEKVSGLNTEHIHYYLVLANWKLGIVLEKTYAAAVKGGSQKGGADPKITEAFGAMVPDLISTAARLAQSGEEA